MNRLVLALLCCGCTAVQAAENLNFHGTLIALPPCTISNDQTVEVNFSNVLINTIDGTHFIQDVPYKITCGDASPGETSPMTLTLSGSVTDYNPAAIKTDIPDLGIELRQNDKAFTVGSKIVINPQAIPTLKAVPVKKSGATLQEGAFEAWATLQVDYQ